MSSPVSGDVTEYITTVAMLLLALYLLEYCIAVLVLVMESTTIHMMPLVIMAVASSPMDSSLFTSTVGGGVAVAILILVYLVGYHSMEPPGVQVAHRTLSWSGLQPHGVLGLLGLSVSRHSPSLWDSAMGWSPDAVHLEVDH